VHSGTNTIGREGGCGFVAKVLLTNVDMSAVLGMIVEALCIPVRTRLVEKEVVALSLKFYSPMMDTWMAVTVAIAHILVQEIAWRHHRPRRGCGMVGSWYDRFNLLLYEDGVEDRFFKRHFFQQRAFKCGQQGTQRNAILLTQNAKCCQKMSWEQCVAANAQYSCTWRVRTSRSNAMHRLHHEYNRCRCVRGMRLIITIVMPEDTIMN
jgi:hypothetical protein